MLYVFLLAGAAGLCVYVPLRLRGLFTPAVFVKAALSTLFVLTGLWGALARTGAGAETGAGGCGSPLAFFVLAGLLFGLLGDVWLGLKDKHPEAGHRRPYMLAGFACFGVGHCLYFAGLWAAFGAGRWGLLLWPVAGGAVLMPALLLGEKPLQLHYGRFRVAVLPYSFILGASAVLPCVLALSGAGAGAGSGRLVALFAVGMAAFLLSDLVLSLSYFSQRPLPRAVLLPANYLLYYGAQFTIAATLYMPL